MNTLNKNQGIGFSKSRRNITLLAVAGVIGLLGMDKKASISQAQQFVLAADKGAHDEFVRNALARRMDTVLNQYNARKDFKMINAHRVYRIQNAQENFKLELGSFPGMGENCMIVTGKNENKEVHFIYNADGVIKNLSKDMSYGDLAEVVGILESSM